MLAILAGNCCRLQADIVMMSRYSLHVDQEVPYEMHLPFRTRTRPLLKDASQQTSLRLLADCMLSLPFVVQSCAVDQMYMTRKLFVAYSLCVEQWRCQDLSNALHAVEPWLLHEIICSMFTWLNSKNSCWGLLGAESSAKR